MKRFFGQTLMIIGLIGFSATAWGQGTGTGDTPDKPQTVVDTNWKGVKMQLYSFERIEGNRLLVTICLTADPDAPSSTLIGTATIPTPAPVNHLPGQHPTFFATPGPFSLTGCTMVDELSQRSYNAVPPPPKGPIYSPSAEMADLSPGQNLYMSVEFPVPPPPPPGPDGKIPVQTVSIYMTNTTAPFMHIVIPPADAAQ